MSFSAVLLVVILGCAAGVTGVPASARTRRPLLTLAVCGLLCVFLAAQLLHPALLTALQRDAAKIRAGEWWRMATALLVQDGWLAGGIFNITALLAMGSLAEGIFDRRTWLVMFCAGAAMAEIAALSWQPLGAGNSIAALSLAGALSATLPPAGARRAWVLRALVLIAAILLLIRHDIHGVAVATGAVLAAVRVTRRKRG